MIRIQQMKLAPGLTQEQRDRQLTGKVLRLLRIKQEQLEHISIMKCSVDARKKPDIYYVYSVDVALKDCNEEKIVTCCRDRSVSLVHPIRYRFPACHPNRERLKEEGMRPVIVGTGPAGLFCGYMLARAGYRPILLERGRDVETRQQDVEAFWQTGILDQESNVQFGEGGAGTFSDGKLNTLVKDKDGRGRFVLEVFVENGAPEEILYDSKPHIGTDILARVIKHMRLNIIDWGGEVRFGSCVSDLLLESSLHEGEVSVTGVRLKDGSILKAPQVILATGHSARDTFYMLYEKGVPMDAKSFAVGLRVQHPQKMIDDAQYGKVRGQESSSRLNLPPAPYKLTARTANGRGVYSFCMCPGGYVVNASSEEGMVAVNGMSYSQRDASNANSAIIVSVTPDDFAQTGPLAGLDFQQQLEKKAWQLGKGSVPIQNYGDFAGKHMPKESQTDYAEFKPCIKGAYTYADLRDLLPPAVYEAFVEGMTAFGHSIKGFDHPSVLLAGVESRTSSPVRIHRDETGQSKIRGLYPCGEGAGYAGGIMSAAMDGMRIAEAIAQNSEIH